MVLQRGLRGCYTRCKIRGELAFMGIKDRLKFIARSYLNSAKEKGMGSSSGSSKWSLDFFGSENPRPAQGTDAGDEDLSDMDFEAQWEAFQRSEDERLRQEGHREKTSYSDSSRSLAQCYKNLELPVGADLQRVRTSYKKLMMKYHPDRQGGDPEKVEAATKVAQKLSESYQIIKTHLAKP